MKTNYIDKTDAPAGYYPVSKDSVQSRSVNANFCRKCDWRQDCDLSVCSCRYHDRKDGQSVIFKLVDKTT